MAERIIVTGGAGYIGSHVCVELLAAGKTLLVIDDFSNSSPEALRRVEEIAGARVDLLKVDMADQAQWKTIRDAAKDFGAQAAVHLAGLKAVGESVVEPERYYRVNLGAALSLIDALKAAGARLVVFSSSATVYGAQNPNPVDESGRLEPANPYGRTKLVIEEMLRDVARADPAWKIANLRYFNPVGAHSSGRIGEDPRGVPNNLFPFIAQVAVGKRDKVRIFGDDYQTRDGTGVRDYIHVVDLARGHLAALDCLAESAGAGAIDINLGTGAGYSVLEAIDAFERAAGCEIAYEYAPRRSGDIAEIYANPGKAHELFGWKADKSLDEMCADHWRWQRNNPDGYGD